MVSDITVMDPAFARLTKEKPEVAKTTKVIIRNEETNFDFNNFIEKIILKNDKLTTVNYVIIIYLT